MKKFFIGLVLFLAPFFVQASAIELLSKSSAGVLGNGASSLPAVSSDGRYVAFSSSATNLVASDTNAKDDIFVYDRTADTIERLSVSDAGVEANGHSYVASISDDGRYVEFYSLATNLVLGDTNGKNDIFVYDRDTDTVERVSVSSSGVEGDGNAQQDGAISSTGRYVVFASDATNLVVGDTNAATDVFVRDRDTDTTERVSLGALGVEGNGSSAFPDISADGRFVVFRSGATNLVGGDTNAKNDIFVYDRDTDTIERVSISSAGIEANNNSSQPSLSPDGRYVTFSSTATNLVGDDTNAQEDVFVYDRDMDTVERTSVNDAGVQGNNVSSTNSHTTRSGNRYVAFYSNATNLVAGDTNATYDAFVRDVELGTTQRVSVSDAGVQGNSFTFYGVTTPDGRFALFVSYATNLVAGDTNGMGDVFIVDRAPTTTVITTITNDNGGTLVLGDVTTLLDGMTITDSVATTTTAAAHTVTQTGTSGYTTTFGGDCDSGGALVLEYGDTATCTIALDDIAPTLTVSVSVINDDAGGETSDAVALFVDGLPIAADVATTTSPGTSMLTATVPEGYGAYWEGDCDEDGLLVVALGGTYACTLVVDDQEASSGERSAVRSRSVALVAATSLQLMPTGGEAGPTLEERNKKIAEIKAVLVQLMIQLVAELQRQLAALSV